MWTKTQDLENNFPMVSDLAALARRKMPYFAWEYLDSGTGAETLMTKNRNALDAVSFVPNFCLGDFTPSLETELFGMTYDVPFGIAPIGLTGLMCPQGELMLARTARAKNLPYCLSTVACETPEDVAAEAGGNGWFQLYPPSDADTRNDLMNRAWVAGMKTLVVTIDVPVGSRRERHLRAGLTMPPRKTPLTLWRAASRPSWAIATLRYGEPSFKTLEPYFDPDEIGKTGNPAGKIVSGRADWDVIRDLRANWEGSLVIKGIMSPSDAQTAIDLGADGIVVSNHGGRQFDGGPASIDLLPPIKKVVGDQCKILFDSGLRGGLDIMRALSLGADFCLFGRAFIYGVSALGERGALHTVDILAEDLRNNMIQVGAKSVRDVQKL